MRRSQKAMQELVWLDCLLLLGIPSVHRPLARGISGRRGFWKAPRGRILKLAHHLPDRPKLPL